MGYSGWVGNERARTAIHQEIMRALIENGASDLVKEGYPEKALSYIHCLLHRLTAYSDLLPMRTAERTVAIQGEAVAYQIRRSREASQIRIDAGMDGITLVVPEGRDVDPEKVLLEKVDWVLKQRERFARYRAQMPERRFEEGEAFPVLGTEREVVIRDALFSHVTEQKIHLDREKVEDTSIKEELERLYRAEA